MSKGSSQSCFSIELVFACHSMMKGVYVCELKCNTVSVWNHSYEHELWHDYSSIIQLHSQGIPSLSHFQYGQSTRAHQSHSQITVLCLNLPAHHSGLAVASNIGSVDLESIRPINCVQMKCEAWGSNGLGMVTARKVEKKSRLV